MKGFLLISTSAMTIALTSAAWADSNTVYLDQEGAGATANITQYGTTNYAGYSATPIIQEDGFGGAGGNVLTITQGTSEQGVSGDTVGYQASPTQQGYNLTATINQYGSFNGVEFNQQGGNNALTVEQDTASNYANIQQSGYALVANIQQTYSSVANGNTAYVNQIGNNNSVGNGGYYSQPFLQSGQNNQLNAAQGGSYNSLQGSQTGNYNVAFTLQTGTNNNATINQH